MNIGWDFNETDKQTAEDLSTFLPKEVYDIHAHLYKTADFAETAPFWEAGPAEVTEAVWKDALRRQLPRSKLAGGLFFPMPLMSAGPNGCGLDAVNDYLVSQLEILPQSRGLILVGPQYSRERALRYFANPKIMGFKPYHILSTSKPTWEAPLRSYLPEWAWESAHERELIIMLHMVRDRALADPENQREILEMCRKYPQAKLILAHAARGFHPTNTVKGLSGIRNLQNVWFDTSAICESAAILAILKAFGPRRLLWGSDFPVSQLRGKCVGLGTGFAWLQWDTLRWDSAHVRTCPTLVGLESLRAIREAAEVFGLNEEDVKDVFCRNAQRVLGLDKDSGNLTQDTYTRAKQRIPGGTQLLSKRPEKFAPDQWPAYFREARGCEVWDLDGRHYYDLSTNSVGACLLGYCDPHVTRAVHRRINLGSISSLNPPEEVALADRLCEIHPWAEQARFVRGGGEAVAVAVRIARATTDRSLVAVCGYHGWHDWYLAANLGENDLLRGHLLAGLDPIGVPRELRSTTFAFTYNNRNEFEEIVRKHGNRLAAVVMEPCRHHDPDPGFLEFVRDATHECGAQLIFDEVSVGWRLIYGGAHLRFGVQPDIAVFAKALGNGHPIGAVIGTREAMDGANSSFISSTYWTEAVGPAAALATLDKMAWTNVPAHVERIGGQVKAHWDRAAQQHEIPVKVSGGYSCLGSFTFTHEQDSALRTLYTQYMLQCGFLAGCHIYVTLAHTDEIVSRYAESVDEVFARMAEALRRGDVEKELAGPIAHAGFQRLIR